MLKQRFIVTLETPTTFDRYFPKVEAERMANIIRDGVEAKSVSFMGSIPFTIIVERSGDVVSALGQMREYVPEEYPEIEEAVQEAVEIDGAVLTKHSS